jgi:protocatechuate 3,4-dioxygenase beta subunit
MRHATRRQFLSGIGAATLLGSTRRLEAALLGVRPSIELVDASEAGERLVVSGTILGVDGNPAPGARLRVYHTDSEGYYTRPVSDPRRARIKGSLAADAAGRYEIRTILPGHYPGSQIERHIHAHLMVDGYPDHWIDSFLFEGDPYVRADELAKSQAAGRFAHVMAMKRENSAIVCRRDIRLDAALAERNRLVDGWYRQ